MSFKKSVSAKAGECEKLWENVGECNKGSVKRGRERECVHQISSNVTVNLKGFACLQSFH